MKPLLKKRVTVMITSAINNFESVFRMGSKTRYKGEVAI